MVRTFKESRVKVMSKFGTNLGNQRQRGLDDSLVLRRDMELVHLEGILLFGNVTKATVTGEGTNHCLGLFRRAGFRSVGLLPFSDTKGVGR